jgi:hypothetical protein
MLSLTSTPWCSLQVGALFLCLWGHEPVPLPSLVHTGNILSFFPMRCLSPWTLSVLPGPGLYYVRRSVPCCPRLPNDCFLAMA